MPENKSQNLSFPLALSARASCATRKRISVSRPVTSQTSPPARSRLPPVAPSRPLLKRRCAAAAHGSRTRALTRRARGAAVRRGRARRAASAASGMTPPAAAATPAAAIAVPTPHCTICLNPPAATEAATLSACRHTFCLPCILSWALADPRLLCPNCKTEFDTLILPRDAVSGALLSTPAELELKGLLAAPMASASVTQPMLIGEARSSTLEAWHSPRSSLRDTGCFFHYMYKEESLA